MEVSANMTLVFPSMLVLRTQRLCLKLGGTTSDMVALAFYLKQAPILQLFNCRTCRKSTLLIKSFFERDNVPETNYSFSSERILALGLVTLGKKTS